MGKLAALKPQGMDIAGIPVRLKGPVKLGPANVGQGTAAISRHAAQALVRFAP